MFRTLRALLLVVVAMRIVAVFLTRDDIVFRVPYLDAAFYRTWAQSLATGAGDFADAYFLGPLYPHFLAGCFRLGLDDPFAIRCVQTGLGILDIGAVLYLGSRLHSTTVGLLAALLLAFHGTLFFYEGLLVMESLLTTVVLAACVLLLLPASRFRLRLAQMLAVGTLLGWATLGRGTALLLAPLAMAFVWREARGVEARNQSAGHAAASAAILCAALLLSWGAWLLPALRHNAAHGEPWTLTTNAGVNFYAGNHEGSRGRFRPPPGIEFFTATSQLAADTSLPPAVAARALTTAAVAGTAHAADSKVWLQRSGDWIAAHPVAFVALLARKAGLVLQGREIGQIESPAFQRTRMPLVRFFWVGWSVVLPLAVLGVWFGWRTPDTRPAVRRAGLLVLALLAPCVIFFVTARYRLVALPLVCLLAGIGLHGLVALWPAQRSRFVAAALVLLAMVAATRVGGRPPDSAAGWENAQMAERFYAVGDLNRAIQYQEQAAAHAPQRREVQINLALYWSERAGPGDVERAEANLRQLAVLHPQDVLVLFNWASVLAQGGDRDTARRVYERVLELDPAFAPAQRNLRALSP